MPAARGLPASKGAVRARSRARAARRSSADAMNHRPRAKAARHGPAGEGSTCRRRPWSAGPRHAACGGPACAQGHRGRMGRHPCLHAAASPPMSPWGGFGGRGSYWRGEEEERRVSPLRARRRRVRSGGGPGPRAPRPSRRRLRPRCHAASARLMPGLSPAFGRAAPACPFRAGPRRARARARCRPGRPPALHGRRSAAFIGPPPCGQSV